LALFQRIAFGQCGGDTGEEQGKHGGASVLHFEMYDDDDKEELGVLMGLLGKGRFQASKGDMVEFISQYRSKIRTAKHTL
jgi:hypothetical protein